MGPGVRNTPMGSVTRGRTTPMGKVTRGRVTPMGVGQRRRSRTRDGTTRIGTGLVTRPLGSLPTFLKRAWMPSALGGSSTQPSPGNWCILSSGEMPGTVSPILLPRSRVPPIMQAGRRAQLPQRTRTEVHPAPRARHRTRPSPQRALSLSLLRERLPAATNRAASVRSSRRPWPLPAAQSILLRRSARRIERPARHFSRTFEGAGVVKYSFQVAAILKNIAVACAGTPAGKPTPQVNPPAKEKCRKLGNRKVVNCSLNPVGSC